MAIDHDGLGTETPRDSGSANGAGNGNGSANGSANGSGKSKSHLSLVPSPDAASTSWRLKLIRSGANYKANLANALTALRHAPEWRGVLRYDELARRIDVEAPLPVTPWPRHDANVVWVPRPWDDQDDRLLAEWLQRLRIDVRVNIAADAAETVARENPYHPIQDYLNKLKWDGTPRLATWLVDYFGAEPSDYHAAVGTRWMISAVARAMQPGCKVDCMLILEGAQGLGKGKSLEAMVPVRSWFTDGIKEFGTLESARQLAGKWLVESSELEGIKGTSGRKAISEGVKAFLSRAIDNYRAPYGRRAQDHLRQCVFVGTTNQAEIFTDATGNRRFWPVQCATAKPEALRSARDQLWAEALHQYRAGVPWWLDEAQLQELAAAAVEERFEVDLMEPDVERYVDGKTFVTVADVATMVFNKELEQVTDSERSRVMTMLTRLGWEKGRSFKKDSYNRRGYVFKGSPKKAK